MNKINVVNVITDTNIGGAGKVLENYLAHYDSEVFEVTVILPAGSSLAEVIRQYNAKVVTMDGLTGYSMDIKSILPLRKLLKELKPDIVHTHASLSARIAAKLYGRCKIVYTRHCAYPLSGFMKSFAGRTVGRITAGLFSDIAIAISPAVKENLTDMGLPEKMIRVFMNGAEALREFTETEKAEVRLKYGIGENDKIAGMISRLEPVKGHEYFIEAAKICVKQDKNSKFIIAGSGAIEAKLKQKAIDHGIESNIIFTGFLSDVAPIVNILDVFVNASYGTEASSIAMLEAMSLGKPVVATDYGGNPYQVKAGVTGLLVTVKNSVKLADAITAIFKDEDIARNFAENTISEYKENYTAEVMCRNIESVYHELVDK